MSNSARPSQPMHASTTPMVTITDTARAAIAQIVVASADGRETGGVLLGHHHLYPAPVLDVVHAEGPGPGAVRHTDFFRRDVAYAQKQADLAYYTDASIWIGDWHTHPYGPARPSHTDLSSYRTLLADPELGFAVFLTIIVTPDPATGWERPHPTGWLITAGRAHPAQLHARPTLENASR